MFTTQTYADKFIKAGASQKSALKILISGSSGLVGGAVRHHLVAGGHKVARLVRDDSGRAHDVQWNPARLEVTSACLEGFDAIIHLAGENIASGRWTPSKKHAIRDSRVLGTQLLAEKIARLSRPPRVFICASAVGYYGDQGDTQLTEDSPPGTGFLADVCRDWEAAAAPLQSAGIRTVRLRMGIVLSRHGGALGVMLPVFRLGLGGVVGGGRQYWSWISLRDTARVVAFALENSDLDGPVNAVSPNPVTNREFTHALSRVLHRPALLPLPAFAAKFVLGELAEATLLVSARVEPAKLTSLGFHFEDAEIEGCLRSVVG